MKPDPIKILAYALGGAVLLIILLSILLLTNVILLINKSAELERANQESINMQSKYNLVVTKAILMDKDIKQSIPLLLCAEETIKDYLRDNEYSDSFNQDAKLLIRMVKYRKEAEKHTGQNYTDINDNLFLEAIVRGLVLDQRFDMELYKK